jgi:hypothetical protein
MSWHLPQLPLPTIKSKGTPKRYGATPLYLSVCYNNKDLLDSA